MRFPSRTLLALALVTAGVLIVRARRPDPDATGASIFHPSDVALLASTGRPQLVEFFHHA